MQTNDNTPTLSSNVKCASKGMRRSLDDGFSGWCRVVYMLGAGCTRRSIKGGKQGGYCAA